MTGVLLQSHNVINVLIIVNHRDFVSCLKSKGIENEFITNLQQSTVVFVYG